MNTGSVFELVSSTTVVLASVSADGEVNAGSAFELFSSSITWMLGSVECVGEVKIGS